MIDYPNATSGLAGRLKDRGPSGSGWANVIASCVGKRAKESWTRSDQNAEKRHGRVPTAYSDGFAEHRIMPSRFGDPREPWLPCASRGNSTFHQGTPSSRCVASISPVFLPSLHGVGDRRWMNRCKDLNNWELSGEAVLPRPMCFAWGGPRPQLVPLRSRNLGTTGNQSLLVDDYLQATGS